MTATAMSPSLPRQGLLQPAKRIKPARWRDARLAAGVALLLASVLVGARLIGGADRTVPFVAVASNLPAGHLLLEGDFEQVATRLTSAAAVYIPWAQAPKLVGRSLSRAVARHELIPLSAVVVAFDPAHLRDVPLVVDGLRSPKVHLGDLVDVYSTTKSLSREEPAITKVIVLGAEVVGEPPARDSSVKVRIVVRVPAPLVDDLVRATELSEIDIVAQLPPGQQ